MGKPGDGRMVTRYCGVTVVPDIVRAVQREQMTASAVVASAQANCSPTHDLGPVPNGMYACRGTTSRRPSSQRDGSKRSGSGNQRASWCSSSGLTATIVPAGACQPPKSALAVSVLDKIQAGGNSRIDSAI